MFVFESKYFTRKHELQKFVGHLMRNRKDMNRISFLNRGYAFKGLLAVNKANEAFRYMY